MPDSSLPMECGLALHLLLRDVPVTVRTDSPQLLEVIKEYFAPFIVQASSEEGRLVCVLQGTADVDTARLQDLPGRRGKPPKESYYDTPNGRVVVKKRTGMVIYSDGPTRIVMGDAVAHVNQVINAIQQVYMEEHVDRDYFLLHAAAVASVHGDGVLIASPSGVGKSSAALATMDRGFKFMSNDRVLVQLAGTGARLVGVPKKPRINPGTVLALPSLHHLIPEPQRNEYAQMEPDDLWRLESKLDVDVESVYGRNALMLEAPLKYAFLLEWAPGAGSPRIVRASLAEGVERLEKQLVNEGPYRPSPPPIPPTDVLAAMLSDSNVFLVKGGVDLAAFAAFAAEAAMKG